MIFAHIIAGLIPIDNFKFSWFWFAGSVAPDIDHIFVFINHKVFSWKKIIDSLWHEEKYGIQSRTKYMHSFLGAAVFSLPVFLFNASGGLYFFAGYFFHLILDWPDKDAKQYFYPLKTEFKGPLAIFSNIEKIFTLVLFLLIILIYIWIWKII